MTTLPAPDISIIIPMYNESAGLELLFKALKDMMASVPESFEILCIDDNSTDDTFTKLKGLQTGDARIKIIRFSRNFGKEAGLTAGIDHATGRAVIPIDADLQDPPILIPEMIAKWKEGYDVVLATRRSRPGESWAKRTTAGLFYRFMNTISRSPMPANTGDFRLMDRKVIDVVKALPERTRFMKGLFSWPGFTTTQIFYDRPNRAAGNTSWNYWKLWQFALDGIVSFSTWPLKVWTYIGTAISFIAFVYMLFLVLRTLILGSDVPGYASIMSAVLFMGGIQLIGIGIIGEYVARIYKETKHRPIYVVRETMGIHNDKTA